MNARRVRHERKLEPTLGAISSDSPAVEFRAEAPINTKKKPKRIEESVTKPEIEIKRPVIVLASLLLLVSTVMFAIDQLFSPDSFEIEELNISADFDQLTPDVIRQEILPLIQNNYFAVDLKEVEQKVRNIDWVDQVSVRRQWPRSIHVRLSEQEPLAQWGEQGYLNTRAEPFYIDGPIEVTGLPYLHGPVGTGKQLLEQYHRWKALLAEKQLELESLTMSPRYAYQAKVKVNREQQKQLTEAALMMLYEEKRQPVPVLDWRRIKPFYLTLQLGKSEMKARLQRFIAAFPGAFNDQLLKVNQIDLRYPNGFAVRWNEEDLPQDFLQLAVSVDEKN